ncbi:MAG: tetratricopeptide repeat protein [Flavobacteriales bacterium]|nr:tetratricopeptide repeat protein [Flavobacteriales bacterium]
MKKLNFHVLTLFIVIAALTGNSQQSTYNKLISDSIDNVIDTSTNDTLLIKQLQEFDDLIYHENRELDFIINNKIEAICLENLKDTLDQTQQLKFSKSLSKTYNIYANIYYDNGNFKKALEYYLKAELINSKNNDQKSLSKS